MRSTSRGHQIFFQEGSKRGRKFDKLKNSDLDDHHKEEAGDRCINITRRLSSNASVSDSEINPAAPKCDVSNSLMVLEDRCPFEPSTSNSPFSKSPWSCHMSPRPHDPSSSDASGNALVGMLVRKEGPIYSMAATGDLLYTGSDSKNIRVWKNQQEFSAFKADSGLVKAIAIAGRRVFTGHKDGGIRVWKVSKKNESVYKRVGTLPTMGDYIKSSMKPKKYAEVRHHHSGMWIKHYDAVSCLSLSEDRSLLYSASWDKTFKVWRISDSKCLESITAHDDDVNSLVAGFDGLVFTGSADGTIKVWRRERQGKGTKHFFSQTLLKQECAVTALAINPKSTIVYSGSSDGLVNYWERESSLSHGGVLKSHRLAVLCLATAGELVFSGSADMVICVWKRTSAGEHTCLSVLTGHTGPIKCLDVEKDKESKSSDEQRWILYSGSLDESVRVWKLSEQAPNNIVKFNQQHNSTTTTTGAAILRSALSFSTRGRSSSVKR
ncbi:hypothetical protein I3760_02G013500 [Carya illinoinensis]|uniref:Uncharacterized protein n=1 Tax=Carya illinoinensis TaxID=32201 RepID=A0A8T1R9G0_CARIL|nr:protein JINGUBANG-like [Carya illinoinensis]KAG2719925.1 hypothetical protein I3760_02G013500 [Carya illinoinensis]KAG6663235.1 hypothetical protein CIPAW_02G013000 [Carya illinoinensis]KAG6725041.1 hypothetical protein I3842_02G013300 [Carya illinoinensis]